MCVKASLKRVKCKVNYITERLGSYRPVISSVDRARGNGTSLELKVGAGRTPAGRFWDKLRYYLRKRPRN